MEPEPVFLCRDGKLRTLEQMHRRANEQRERDKDKRMQGQRVMAMFVDEGSA